MDGPSNIHYLKIPEATQRKSAPTRYANADEVISAKFDAGEISLDMPGVLGPDSWVLYGDLDVRPLDVYLTIGSDNDPSRPFHYEISITTLVREAVQEYKKYAVLSEGLAAIAQEMRCLTEEIETALGEGPAAALA